MMGAFTEQFGQFGRVFGGLMVWFNPKVPDHIRPALQQAQFDSVRKQIPMLLSVAAMNTLVIMAVCANQRLSLSSYIWLSGLVAYCVIRNFFWIRRMRKPFNPVGIARMLRLNTMAALMMILFLGFATTYTFVAGTFDSMLLIPVSLGFGTTSIAHCLYTLRPAAIGTILLGLFPSSIAMMIVGQFEAQMLGVAMASVGVLMVRFVAEQHDQLITNLQLAHDNQRLALTDPLTGLANRRAILVVLDDAELQNSDFAVALIDLDGFKQVNDTFGHHVGDYLLCETARRLESAVQSGDIVGRLGGDEFVIIFCGSADEADCSARTNAVLGTLCRPVFYEDQRLKFGASLGFAISGMHAANVAGLLQSADHALYAAKRRIDATTTIEHCAARRAA